MLREALATVRVVSQVPSQVANETDPEAGGVISILLPSVRPEKLPFAMACIPAAVGSVSYEVVVVADFGPEEYPYTRWFVRPRKGVIDAIHTAYEASQGEYVFLFNDESKLDAGALQSLYYATLSDPWRVLSPYHHPPFNFQYYGLPFAPFPFVRRDLIEELGGFLDPAFGSYYADPDFSLRAHAKRIPVEVLHSATVRQQHAHDEVKRHNWATYFDKDRATFRSRWDHLGTFKDP